MPKHRMNRPTYWLCYVVFMLVVSILAYLGKLNGGMEVAMILVGIPRLHDIGRSGWIVGAVIAIEIMVLVGAALAGVSVDTLLITSGMIFFSIAALGIWLGIVPGDAGTNKWGETPKAGVNFGIRKPAA